MKTLKLHPVHLITIPVIIFVVLAVIKIVELTHSGAINWNI